MIMEGVNKTSLTTILALSTFDLGCLHNITYLKLHGKGVYDKKFITNLQESCKLITHLSLNGDAGKDSDGRSWKRM